MSDEKFEKVGARIAGWTAAQGTPIEDEELKKHLTDNHLDELLEGYQAGVKQRLEKEKTEREANS